MHYALLCFDKPNSGELRELIRPRHLEFLKQHASVLRMGGPLENADGGAVGAIFVIDVEDRVGAMAFTEEEPYHKAGLYEAIIVRRWRQVIPEVEPGASSNSSRAAALQLKEEGQ